MNEYAGLYLAPTGDSSNTLAARLSPLPKEPKVAVRAAMPHVSPWRVFLIGDRAGRLIESDLVNNLSDPCAIKDTSWITTGKTTFPWWNGYYEEHVPFKPGLNTATMKHYIDFCAEAGIPFHSLDGIGDTSLVRRSDRALSRAPTSQEAAWARPARSSPLCEGEGRPVCGFGCIGRRPSSTWNKSFPLYRQWGIQDVMIDFMDRDDQEMYRSSAGWSRRPPTII